MTINNRFLAGKQWCSRWMLSILSQPILAPKYNVHQRSKEHDMVSVSLSAFVLLYSNFQVQRLAWNLWIRINLFIRHILMIRHECCVIAIFEVSNISQPPFFHLQELVVTRTHTHISRCNVLLVRYLYSSTQPPLFFGLWNAMRYVQDPRLLFICHCWSTT